MSSHDQISCKHSARSSLVNARCAYPQRTRPTWASNDVSLTIFHAHKIRELSLTADRRLLEPPRNIQNPRYATRNGLIGTEGRRWIQIRRSPGGQVRCQ